MNASTHCRQIAMALSVVVLFGLAACSGGGSDGGNGGDMPIGGESPPACTAGVDTDSDGLTDCEEADGWTVFVDENGYGTTVERHVTGDPSLADTDGDGLDDYAEFTSKSDPRRADTDGDGLADPEEMSRYGSNPNSVDTDGDARGPDADKPPNSALFDGNELAMVGTSPALADTDGDTLTDYEEVVGGGSNPLTADLPQMELEFVGAVDIQLDAVLSSSCTLASSTFSASLVQSSKALNKSSSVSSRQAIKESASIRAMAEASAFPPGVNAKLTGSASVSRSTVQASSASWTGASASTARQQYQEAREEKCFEGTEAGSGTVTIGFQVANTGGVAFTLSNLNLTVLKRDPLNPEAFKTLASAMPLTTPVNLAAGSATGPRAVLATVPAPLAMELLEDPSGLFFEVGSYDMVDEAARNFAFIQNTTLSRTGLVVIDFGNGTVERHLVATNVERNPDGSAAGLPLAQALEIIGFTKSPVDAPGTYRTEVNGDGVSVLAALNGFAHDESVRQFWYVMGTTNSLDTPDVDFEDIVLHQGDYINLTLLRDSDLDDLWDREENFYGTDPNLVDTDGDTLSDWTEVNTGWSHGIGGTPVTSSPIMADTDGDGLRDDAEKTAQTDARDPDSDDDGLPDGDELAHGADPLVPDTDGDGMADGPEVAAGRDPTVPQVVLEVLVKRIYISSASCDPDGIVDLWYGFNVKPAGGAKLFIASISPASPVPVAPSNYHDIYQSVDVLIDDVAGSSLVFHGEVFDQIYYDPEGDAHNLFGLFDATHAHDDAVSWSTGNKSVSLNYGSTGCTGTAYYSVTRK